MALASLPRRRVTSVLLLLAATVSLGLSQTSRVLFKLREEMPTDTLIGNVATESKLEEEVTPEVFAGLRYKILSSDGLRISSLFTINSRTGALFTNAMIDREQVCDSTAKTCQLEFDVTVKSEVTVIKLLNVVVEIEELNDNPPSFNSNTLKLSVSEASQVGSEISVTGAIDRDAGLETNISYWMEDNDVFGLREEKLLDVSVLKIVLLQSLDREKEPSYRLNIFAKDGVDSSALTGTLSVTITVTDVNDHSPEFSQQVYNFTVKEDAERGSLVGTIVATDLDADDNGRIQFQFSSLTSSRVLQLFNLDPSTGNITVKSTLQYESMKQFQAVVEAKDQGGSPRASQAVLIINVKDSGNTPPKLSLTLENPLYADSMLLPEDIQVGFFVGTLKYQDNDNGDNGLVACSSMNSHFSLQSLEDKGYGIEVSSSLDRESQTEMIVVLRCSDRGSPSLSAFANFTVLVSDANDNAPVFLQPDYSAVVTEGVNRQSNIVKVEAKDADEGDNSEVRYQLTASSSNAFTVDPLSGWLSLVDAVDRESEPLILLTVEAVDQGLDPHTGTVTVTVSVQDINDNAPEIISKQYTVKENQQPETIVTTEIGAFDKDVGKNSEMEFALVSDPANAFRVSKSGLVTTAVLLDRESVAYYFLVVSVRDKGSSSLSSTATLTITVKDTNDHSPQIIYPVSGNDSVTISANLSPGSVVARIGAEDKDVEKNGKLMYLIAEGNPHKIFSIDNSTGTVFVAKRLTTTRVSSYRLTISVQDGGNPRLHNNAYLFVKIDFTNATLLGSNSAEQKYVIIAGIIAGITVVIAVIVITIIFKLRRSDPVICEEGGPKSKDDVTVSEPAAKNIHELRLRDAPKFRTDETDREAGFRNSQNKPRDPNSSFDSHVTNGSVPLSHRTNLTRELLDQHIEPSFSLFPQGRQRQASDDINSDASGEATTSDSGRGASDGEDSNMLGGSPPLPYKPGSTVDLAPRVPPRQPVQGSIPDSQLLHQTQLPQTVLSGEPPLVGDLSRAARPYASHKQLAREKKLPGKVRFSLDDHSVLHDTTVTSPSHFRQPAVASARPPNPKHLSSHYPNVLRSTSSGINVNTSVPSRELYKHQPLPVNGALPRDSWRSQSSASVPLSREAVARHEMAHSHVHGRGKQQQSAGPNFCDKNSYPLLPHHPHLPLSSLNHSLDDDEDDDGSTTTSGSYAIDGLDESVGNLSVEC